MHRKEVTVNMAGGMFDPKKRRIITAVIAILLVLAMIVPTVLSLVMY